MTEMQFFIFLLTPNTVSVPTVLPKDGLKLMKMMESYEIRKTIFFKRRRGVALGHMARTLLSNTENPHIERNRND